jgi:hypothetical protein
MDASKRGSTKEKPTKAKKEVDIETGMSRMHTTPTERRYLRSRRQTVWAL